MADSPYVQFLIEEAVLGAYRAEAEAADRTRNAWAVAREKGREWKERYKRERGS